MSYVAYFVGGPMDLTKRVMEGTGPGRSLTMRACLPMFLHDAKSFDDIEVQIREDVYELIGRGRDQANTMEVYVFEYRTGRGRF